ncbi:hypothetical protein ACFV27_37380 [Streptomyces antimycoticus]|uniref:hypothetical protein n=1 Tax=Streptomyces antimycoticus TaxID=68175 RepID=UPI0036CED481
MTLVQAPLLTAGATHSAQTFRMMVRDLARGNEGVTEGTDLKVTQLSTPGTSVQIGDGSGVIRGRANPFQGHYSAYNIGAATVPIASTGASARTDMVVLRVLDPEYEGGLNPASGQICFFEVVSNVSSTATSPPGGYTAIPLARIMIPASTSIITDSMITDLRKIANPRKDRQLLPFFYPGPLVEISGTSETWQNFPSTVTYSIAVPTWAAKVRVKWDVCGIRLVDGNVFGSVSFQFGTKDAAQWVSIDDNQGTAARRTTIVMADTLSLTDTLGAAMRGTTITLRSRMRTRSANAGKIGVDGATTFVADVEFEEGLL